MVLGLILVQAGYYAIVLILTVVIISLLLRGFFWKYLKVKTSFGKYVMVKVRTTLRDYFVVGWVEDGFLVYKRNKEKLNISLGKENYFYRTLGVNWIDIDEEKGSPCKVNYEAVEGHDLQKESNLLTRALTRPSVADNRERIILILLALLLILAFVSIILGYSNYSLSKIVVNQIPTLAKAAQITAGNVIV